MSELLDAALHYASMAWHVFPVERAVVGNDKSGKRPVGQLAPNGKLNATTDPQTIRGWWSQGDWNIGIACEPSKLVVLDVDVGLKKDGTFKQGEASLKAIDQYLTPTLTAATGSGGTHAFYARPADFATGSKIGFAEGLDLISNGYVIAAPSNHHSGGTYEWRQMASTGPLPEYLRNIAQSSTRATIKSAQAGVTKVEEGGRNNALFNLGAFLRSGGLTGEALLAALWAENNTRFSPPLGEAEVRSIAFNAMKINPTRDVILGATIQKEISEMFAGPADDVPTVQQLSGVRASKLVSSLMKQSRLPVVHLPYPQLDEQLNGLSLHSMTLLVAGTGKGKSSLAGKIAHHHAHSKQGPVIYYVGEMTQELMLARMVGQILGRSWSDVVRGDVSESEINAALEGLPIYFIKRNPEPLKSILETLKVAAQEGTWVEDNVPMLVIDYIQLMASVGADMRLSTMQAVRDLRAFVENTPVVALVLSQSSRSGAKQMKEGGTAEDMVGMGAETAELEQSATNQLVISYQSVEGSKEHDVTLFVAKSRFGGGAKLGFRFNGRTGDWSELDKPPVSPAHQKRMDEMLAHITAHSLNKCTNGMLCGTKLNKAAFREKKGSHYCDGNAMQQTQALEDLVQLKLIACVHSQFFLPGKAPRWP